MTEEEKRKNMKKIGIIGGGQLGKMMILDAKRLDYYFVILDPVKNCPAHGIANEHMIAAFDDVEAMLKLASMVDVITYEFEHISVLALQKMEAAGHLVYPSSETLLHIQNKYDQKKWLEQHNLPVPRFMKIESLEDLQKASETFGLPMLLKTCTGGYDGKGNALIKETADYESAYESLGAGKLPLMVEEFVPFEKEISVLACQSTCGDIRVFPIAENVHKDNILDETTVPAQISDAVKTKAMDIAKQSVKAFHAYGMLCIELFVTSAGDVLVNELAPRPHNSGHYTIEACVSSQYENHIRAILGLPLGDTSQIKPCAMKNLIGSSNGQADLKGLEEAYQYENVKVHIYGKETVSVGRKMGHITAIDESVEEALSKVRLAHSKLRFSKEGR